ncbi:hypothetical protein ACFLXW_00335 [Candidatus Dependentiae bacterium]
MKKNFLLLLALISTGANALTREESYRLKKSLEGRGINVKEITVATPEVGIIQFITIKNDSPNVITYDPSKITSFLEDNGEKLDKKIKLKRMAYGAGALAALAGFVGGSGYTAQLAKELVRNRPDFRQRGRLYANRGLTGNDPLDMAFGRDLSDMGSMRKRIKGGLVGGTAFLLTSTTGFMAFALLLGKYEELSPKHIIQEKITIDPGKKTQILLWFKSKKKFKSSVGDFFYASDFYQAMDKALEVGQK